MKRKHTWMVLLAMGLPLVGGLAIRGQEAAEPPAKPAKKASADANNVAEGPILAALEKVHNWEFVETPLEDVADFLADLLDVEVQLDKRALEDVGIGTDTPIVFVAKKMRTRSALQHALSPFELTWMIRDEALLITTPEAAESALVANVYPVADIVAAANPDPTLPPDYDSLIEAIVTLIAPNTWTDVGGPGDIRVVGGTLVLSQTRTVHEQLGQFLSAVRTAQQAAEQKPATHAIWVDTKEDVKLRFALKRDFSPDFIEESLEDVAAFVEDSYNINVILDVRALDDVGISTDTPVTLRTNKPIRLGVGLRRLLRDLDLTWSIRDEAIVITTLEAAEAQLDTRLYSLQGLVDNNRPGDTTDELIGAVVSTVAPNSWQDVGGPGAIVTYGNPALLAVSQTTEIHEQVAGLLDQLRQVKATVVVPDAEPLDPDQTTLKVYRLVSNAQAGMVIQNGEVVNLIKKAIDPQSWEQADALVEGLGTNLVIRTTRKNHTAIEKLLGELQLWHRTRGGFGLGGGQGGGLGGGQGGGGFGGGQGGGGFF